MSWSSPFSSWHSRALLTPFPNPHAFTPTKSALLLAVLLNAPVENEGVTLTLFSQPKPDDPSISETVAVDALGRVLIVTPKDSAGILSLARSTLSLPQTGGFRNTWVIKQDRTSQPIDRLFIPGQSAKGLLDDPDEISVQGFSKEKRELKRPVDGITELPKDLWELTGLVLEARSDAGSGSDGRRDELVLGKVRDVVRGLF
ncbi:hypothetical protein Hypma_008412 [Hypsizygus marmoreus]|uniref:Uncharacterized protein n=1 Tax=Hypsizygus marmoreus TaxID=39966 RepID=A0A369JVP7_HYPMA|nr:hypothetical protein Hypma_008412 [Hypsizygus marmoreus]